MSLQYSISVCVELYWNKPVSSEPVLPRYAGQSTVYSPELLERVCAGKVLEGLHGIVSICINFTKFLFVIGNNNKKGCAIFDCHVTSCVRNHYLCLNSLYLEIFEFMRLAFMCFSNKDSFSIP